MHLNITQNQWLQNLKDKMILNFVEDDRWKLVLKGLGTTLKIAFFAVILGFLIGLIIAIVRASSEITKGEGKTSSFGSVMLKVADWICKLYLTVIRGTPVLIQLMIIYFVVFATADVSKVTVAIIAFGINSGAYVAEIIRSGIMSVDEGQFEAGRSLGLNYVQTMIYIIFPQAFKNVLPALANEFIVLLKETSVAGFIGVVDLAKAGDIIRSVTFEAFLPLIVVAIIYLIIVVILTRLVSILERRLRVSER